MMKRRDKAAERRGFVDQRQREARKNFQTLQRAIRTAGLPKDYRETVEQFLPVLHRLAYRLNIATHPDSPGGMTITADELEDIQRALSDAVYRWGWSNGQIPISDAPEPEPEPEPQAGGGGSGGGGAEPPAELPTFSGGSEPTPTPPPEPARSEELQNWGAPQGDAPPQGDGDPADPNPFRTAKPAEPAEPAPAEPSGPAPARVRVPFDPPGAPLRSDGA